MIKKFYALKKFEEVLGLVGLFYFLFLIVFTFFFVRFLVRVSTNAVTPATTSSLTSSRFELELIDQIEKTKQ